MHPRKILVLGSGGREHALCWHLKEAGVDVACAPGSDAIALDIPCFTFSNFTDLLAQLQARQIREVIVGPEHYLAEGVADFLGANDIEVFGPTKIAVTLETDKAWAKEFCFRHQIPTARSITLQKGDSIESALQNFRPPFVVKAAGLAAGKGVWIGDNPSEAADFARSALQSHNSVVIEEFLPGEEISYFVLIDGTKHLFLGAAQDHKRLLENDQGPNTGGMGAYTPVPLLTDRLQASVEKSIVQPILEGLRRDAIHYRGFLFIGLMIVEEKPYVLEFNCRMGDPETQPLMLRLKTPLLELIDSLKTHPKTAAHHEGVALNIVVAARGYPSTAEKGFSLKGIENPPKESRVFHSGTKQQEGQWIANGGRLFSVATLQPSLVACQNVLYPWLESLSFQTQVTYRKDIGAKAFRHLLLSDSNSRKVSHG